LPTDQLTENVKIVQLLENYQEKFEMPNEFLYYIALCGLFPPQRNIIKNWSSNERVFIELVKMEGKVGIDHFMQALVIYFIRKHNSELGKFASTFMMHLLNECVLADKFIIDWYDKSIRLDKESGIYDKKAEKKFRDLIEEFVTYIK